MVRASSKLDDPLRDLTLSQYILSERYESIRHIGDGSFGTVELARRKTPGSDGTLVAIKSMKKQIEPPQDCLKLREVQSLHAIPQHPAIVQVLESFYDPKTLQFHMVMEHMDQNLYQLIKSRQNQHFDLATVKNIMVQILEALEHCHANNYFHRDIKPENVLVTSVQSRNNGSSRTSTTSTVLRAAQFLTPPSTPVHYQIKLADFGLAREITSRPPYTTYVSTRWYRAPEVLLRAESYSAPVDMWALGAMAVEIATLNPLFPGKHEVDQVWRICEVMGSPGDWRNRSQKPVGGGVWKEGATLAEKLGFTFPKVPPRAMEEILGPNWPRSLGELVTELLYWDPRARPTSSQALRHEFLGLPSQNNELSLNVKRTASIVRSDRISVLPETKRSLFKNMQQSLQRGPSVASTRSAVSNLAAGRNSDVQNPGRDIEMSELPSMGTHRQSWFAKKRDSFIGRRSSAIIPDDPPARNTRSKVRDVQVPEARESSDHTPSQPSSIIGSSSDKTPGCLMLPPAPPISPFCDVTTVTKQDYSLAHGFPRSHQSCAPHLQSPPIENTALISTNIPQLNVPNNNANPPNLRKITRSISDYSAEQRSPMKPCAVQRTEHHHGGFTGLFSHLRKKTKRTGPVLNDQITTGASEGTASFNSAAHRGHMGDVRRVPVKYDALKHDDQAHAKERRVLQNPEDNSQVIHLSQSLPAMSIMMPKPTDRLYNGQVKNLVSQIPQSSGPISSRTRKAINQGRRPTDTVVRDEEAELLEAALQSTAHAMQQLEAFPETTQPVLRPIPSYAKSTAASARRSSNTFTAANPIPRSSNRRLTEYRIPFPPSPPNNDFKAPGGSYLKI